MAGYVGILGKAAATVPTFDPLSISWDHAFWAEDPGWSNPGNGNAVASWNNAGTQGVDAAQGTAGNRPTYRSSYANLNNKPAIEFDGSNDYLATSGATVRSQPNHIYVVGYQGSGGGSNQSLIDGASPNRHLVRVKHGSTLLMYAGAVVTPGTAVSGASFQAAALFDSSSSVRVNGQNHTGLAAGTADHGEFTIGASGFFGTEYMQGAIAFVGIKDTALTSTELTDLSAWAVSYYGVPAL